MKPCVRRCLYRSPHRHPGLRLLGPCGRRLFFWTGFAPKWIDLLELYETTGEKRYLEAAHRGARLYTQYIWYCPEVPDANITVNPDGKAPHYAYLKQKGHAGWMPRGKMLPPGRLLRNRAHPRIVGNLHRTPRHLHGQLRRMVCKVGALHRRRFSGRDRQERHRRTLPQFPGATTSTQPARRSTKRRIIRCAATRN